jgi:ABC-type branched-subunit amino acid transport system permease subunit
MAKRIVDAVKSHEDITKIGGLSLKSKKYRAFFLGAFLV